MTDFLDSRQKKTEPEANSILVFVQHNAFQLPIGRLTITQRLTELLSSGCVQLCPTFRDNVDGSRTLIEVSICLSPSKPTA